MPLRLAYAVTCCAMIAWWGAARPVSAADEVETRAEIVIAADFSQEWTEDGVHVAILRGQCRFSQGRIQGQARKMVVWRATEAGVHIARIYLEDAAVIERPEQTLSQPTLLAEFRSTAGITYDIRHRLEDEKADNDPLFRRALTRRQAARGKLVPTQFVVPNGGESGPEFPIPGTTTQPDLRRVRIFPRSSVPPNLLSFESTDTTPAEQVWVLTGGVNIIVDGLQSLETVDLSADRIVVWTQTAQGQDFSGETLQTRDTPLQVYLEGNIVVRQGNNVLRATRAFYDVRDEQALLLDSELRVFVPQIGRDIRVRADRIRQLATRSFHAENAWTTTSPFGKPGYRLQASDIMLEERPQPWMGSGEVHIDPVTNLPVGEDLAWITTHNNAFIVEDVPLLFAPYLSGPAEAPNIPIRGMEVQSDRIFGVQVKSTWDLFKVFGLDSRPGVDVRGQLDWLSDRGPGVGSAGEYTGSDFLLPGQFNGNFISYYVNDHGLDNLGLDRRTLIPESKNRWRSQMRHRQDLPNNMTVWGELGLLSDRNFLEQYYESEFDTGKDVETLVNVKQQFDNAAWTILARPDVNNFETTTQWAPRGDLMVLGEPLFDGLLNWTSRTSLGYASLNPMATPTDPNDIAFLPPYVANLDGGVLMTRHELDMPLSFGPLQLVPYVSGEAAYWSEGLSASDIDRLYGSAGLRASLMMWRIYPNIQSRVFNLNGLAHKMTFSADYYFADSSQNLSDIAQYNEFDDNSQDRFRSRFLFNTFGLALPPQFDPRNYAVRDGSGTWVTSQYHELVDDMQVVRLGWRHRLQTKVGPPDNPRIHDWMTLDLTMSVFPDANRDNFGEDVGLLGANYSWNIGERTSVLANALYDTYSGGQQLWNVGFLSQRSQRGSVYVGLRQVAGDVLDSQILTTSYSYRMSQKWISTFGTAYDLAENRNLGQSMTITRVGLDFLIHMGLSYDQSKGNASVGVSVEPRFGPANAPSQTQLSSLLSTR